MRLGLLQVLLINMEVKKIDKELQSIVDGWISKHGEIHSDMALIPPQILLDGYVSFVDGVPVVATYVYTNDVIAWYAWTTANPDIRGKKRDDGFSLLFQHVNKEMKSKGVICAFAGVTNSSLLKRFYDDGFLVANHDNVHMIKVLE